MGLRTFFIFCLMTIKILILAVMLKKNLNVTVIRPRIANIPKMLGYFCEIHGMIQYIFHNTSFNSHFIVEYACLLADFPCYPSNNTVLRFISRST